MEIRKKRNGKIIFPFKFFLLMLLLLGISNSSKAQKNNSTEKLVVVTLDGLRWQEVFQGADPGLINNPSYYSENNNPNKLKEEFWADTEAVRREKLMPFFWNELVGVGQLYGNREFENFVNVSNPYWFSYPGYNEIWTGYPDTLVDSNKHGYNSNVNVLEFINQQEGFHNNITAFTSSKFFEKIFNIKRNNLIVEAGFKNDSITYNKAKDYLKEYHPRVTYIAFGGTDHHAHQKEYDQYLHYANLADALIGDLWRYLQQDDFYKDKTTLLVTVDHGRGIGKDWHTHGAHNNIEHGDEIWFAVAGPDINPTGEQKEPVQIYQEQFAKTMAAILGLNFNPDHPVGDVIQPVLNKN